MYGFVKLSSLLKVLAEIVRGDNIIYYYKISDCDANQAQTHTVLVATLQLFADTANRIACTISSI
jgi:hypothetical protein